MRVLANITESQRTAIELAGMPSGLGRLFGILVVVGLLYLTVWLYRRESRAGASLRLRMSLAGLRMLVILGLAAIWLEPVRATFTVRTIESNVALVIDQSASMAVADNSVEGLDAADGVTRWDHVIEALVDDHGAWLRRLARDNRLLVHFCGEDARLVPLAISRSAGAAEPAAAPPLDLGPLTEALPDAAASNLGAGVTAAIRDSGEAPLAAIVLISDGARNAGMDVLEIAAAARRAECPVFTVGVGSTAEPPNLRVTSIDAPSAVAQSDPTEVRVGVAATGLPRRFAALTLMRREIDGGDWREIDRREIELGDQVNTISEAFQINTDRAGEYLYRASLAIDPAEALHDDNARDAPLRVLDESLRVLLVAGRPSYDYRYLTRLFERDRSIDVSCWLQSADATAARDGDTPLRELPRNPEDLFAYDAVLLLDPDPAGLDSSWAINVRRLVDELGGGVLLQAGSHYTSRFLSAPAMVDLVAMLPVIPDRDADVRLSEYGSFRTRAAPLRLHVDAATHPLVRLSDIADQTSAVWDALPGVWWRLPVERLKPLATVLLVTDAGAPGGAADAPPLLATQPFGAGRTAFLAFDGTWRWRSTAEPQFNRFWIQMARYLGQRRREGQSNRGVITLEKETLRIGESVRIEAQVLDRRFVPWYEPTILAQIESEATETREVALTAIPGREGWFEVRFTLDFAGSGMIRIPLPGGAPGEALTKYINVRRPDLERRTLRQHGELLAVLAGETGGQYVQLDQVNDVPAWIENRSEVRTIRGRDIPLWDSPYLLAALTGLLAIEWTLRRRNHLL